MTLYRATAAGQVPMTPEEEAEFLAEQASNAILDRDSLAAQIDEAAAAVYDKPMRFSKEYEMREAQAQAYKDAGYTGTVPPRVAGFAEPAGMTAREAADLILSQGVQLRDALDQLSDLRMRKYAVTRAATDEEAQTIFSDTISAINAIAASLA